jgi:hypothetical protein
MLVVAHRVLYDNIYLLVEEISDYAIFSYEPAYRDHWEKCSMIRRSSG